MSTYFDFVFRNEWTVARTTAISPQLNKRSVNEIAGHCNASTFNWMRIVTTLNFLFSSAKLIQFYKVVRGWSVWNARNTLNRTARCALNI